LLFLARAGEQYVGSSVDLGTRVRQYFKPSVFSKNSRPIGNSLREYGLGNFSLAVYKIDPILFNGGFKPLVFSRALVFFNEIKKPVNLTYVKLTGVVNFFSKT
jgi:hypothetical protein